MKSTVVFAILAIPGICIVAEIICDYRLFNEYRKWAELAERDFNVGPEEFSKCMEFAKQLYGCNATPRDAYYIAREEWYDLNCK